MGILLDWNDKAVEFDLRCLLLFFNGSKNWVAKDKIS